MSCKGWHVNDFHTSRTARMGAASASAAVGLAGSASGSATDEARVAGGRRYGSCRPAARLAGHPVVMTRGLMAP